MDAGIGPILHQAMLTTDELPGWTAVAEREPATGSPFAHTSYSDRFIGEASLRLEKDDTGEILVQHIGVLPAAETAQLEQDLASASDCADEHKMLQDGAEAWAVAPLQLPRVAAQAVSFRLIAGLPDARFLLADNVYMRRGCLALVLVRMDTELGGPESAGMAPLAELADRKLAAAAEKIGAV